MVSATARQTIVFFLIPLLIWGCSPIGTNDNGAGSEDDTATEEDPSEDPNSDPSDPYDDPSDDTPLNPVPTPAGCRKVDILFVIDNSGSMTEEQENLARNFPEFIRQLEEYRTDDAGTLDYRVGVTSTSRARLTFDTSITYKQGGPRCEETSECSNERHVCECPALGFTECSAECPGNCFCEPAGFTIPARESCAGEDGMMIIPPGRSDPWIDGPGDDVAGAFAEAATLGINGCPFEMPLYAAEHALSSSHHGAGENAGFLRDDALLMLIILTDEDDCSTDVAEVNQRTVLDINHPFATSTPDYGCTDAAGNDVGEPYNSMEHYVEFFDTLMGQRNRWAAAVIAGESSCDSEYGSAFTAHRLRRFIELIGQNGVFSDICQADLSSSMADALDTLQLACDEYPLI